MKILYYGILLQLTPALGEGLMTTNFSIFLLQTIGIRFGAQFSVPSTCEYLRASAITPNFENISATFQR